MDSIVTHMSDDEESADDGPGDVEINEVSDWEDIDDLCTY